MADKIVENLEVVVDDLALSILGWELVDVRARLVTKANWNVYEQEIALSAVGLFHPDDRVGAYGDNAPALVLTVQGPDDPVPSVTDVIYQESPKKAAKKRQRLTCSGIRWEVSKPFRADELRVEIRGYDLVNYFDMHLPPAGNTTVPIEIVDETGSAAMRMKPDVAVCLAHPGEFSFGIFHESEGFMRVHLEGICEFGSMEELRKAYLDGDGSWLADLYDDPDLDGEPIELRLPGFSIEILDEEGFVLEQDTLDLNGELTVAEAGEPLRPARWLAVAECSYGSLAGTPSRVIARILDSGDL